MLLALSRNVRGSRRGALRAPGTQIMERSNGFGAVVRPSAEEYKAHEERANADALDPLKRLRSGVRVIPPSPTMIVGRFVRV